MKPLSRWLLVPELQRSSSSFLQEKNPQTPQTSYKRLPGAEPPVSLQQTFSNPVICALCRQDKAAAHRTCSQQLSCLCPHLTPLWAQAQSICRRSVHLSAASFPHSQPALTHPTVEIKAEINPALSKARLCHRGVAEQNRSDPAPEVTSTVPHPGVKVTLRLQHTPLGFHPEVEPPWHFSRCYHRVQAQISGVSDNTASHRDGPCGTKARVLTQPSGNESELEGDPISFLCSGAA